MERRSQILLNTAADWQNSARAAASALSSPEGRWALLSTSLTAMIAGSIAWLAVGTMPPLKAHGFGGRARENVSALRFVPASGAIRRWHGQCLDVAVRKFPGQAADAAAGRTGRFSQRGGIRRHGNP